MVESVILYGVGSLFIMAFHLFCWYKLLGKENGISYKCIIISLIFIAMLGTTLNYTVIPLIKMIFISIIFIIVCYLLFGKKLKGAILAVIISQAIVMIAEVLLVISLPLFFGDNIEEFSQTLFGGILINLLTTIFSLLILRTYIPKKIFDNIMNYANLIRKKEVLIYCIMIIIVLVISTAQSYMNFPMEIVLVTNTLVAVVFIFMVVKFAIAEDKYIRTQNKYQVSITSLKEYEEILDKFRVSTHENKNQLLTIKNMVKDPKVISYIDAIVDEKVKDNEAIMNKAYKIPDARFRSILYPKICKIAELKINYKFIISKEVKTADLIDMDDFLVRDACTILGVYLDNAIEAVENLKKKNIFVEVYIMNGYLCFDITNNFEGFLDIDKLFKPKYTTKGGDHGYGLSLVNKIIKENESIENECEVIKNKITQRLKVKI